MANYSVKTFYNQRMPEKFGDDYEHNRWFKTPIQRTGYHQTKKAIERHVLRNDGLHPLRVLELGPGAGTWTKILVKHFPDTYFDLVDISKEMLARVKKALPDNGYIRYVESDILTWEPEGEYDFFFSSRVLEYIDDKKKFADKIFSLLAPGGEGFVITKMPHYERERFLGRASREFHQGQIAPGALRDTFREAGLIAMDLYPVTVSVPLLHSALANRLLGGFLGKWTLGPFGMFFTESYCLVFRKPQS